MSINPRVIGVVAAAAALVLFAVPSFAALDKCSKLIDGESKKMESSVLTTTNGESNPMDPNEPADELIGGVCTTLTATSGPPGSAFINLGLQLASTNPGVIAGIQANSARSARHRSGGSRRPARAPR